MTATLIAEVTRSGIVESRHYGSIAVVDNRGELIAGAGDVNRVTYMRSAAKPVQAIPVIESGAVDAFGISDKELAVICASHQGQDIHVSAVSSILAKIGVNERSLACGIHPPANAAAARSLVRTGREPRALHNNCSGKHVGMLALAQHFGADLETYLDSESPVQTAIKSALGETLDVKKSAVHLGTDGCGAPTFAVPLRNIALGFARFGDPVELPASRSNAMRRISAAMTDNAEMVSGTGGMDTDVMSVGNGKVMMKGGAEGLKAIALLDRGIGIACRMEDGSDRAFAAIVWQLVRDLGVFSDDDLADLAALQPVAVMNHQGRVIGEIRSTLALPGLS